MHCLLRDHFFFQIYFLSNCVVFYIRCGGFGCGCAVVSITVVVVVIGGCGYGDYGYYLL